MLKGRIVFHHYGEIRLASPYDGFKMDGEMKLNGEMGVKNTSTGYSVNSFEVKVKP